MSRRKSEALFTPFRRAQGFVRPCEAPGCAEEGVYPAPKARDRLKERYWFCLEHVRAYNLAWDFYRGMSMQEIEAHRHADFFWHRPSWPFGKVGNGGRSGEGFHFEDPFGFFDDGPNGKDDGAREPDMRRPSSAEERALAAFDLSPGASFSAIKARYKQLVKMLHPDANGGDREAEERLKVINQAYATLKACYASPTS